MTRSEPAHLPVGVALGGAVLVGVLTAIQARINGQLGLRLDDGFVAAAISFGSGLAVLGNGKRLALLSELHQRLGGVIREVADGLDLRRVAHDVRLIL